MRVLGKCPPTSRELSEASQNGFDETELYVTEQHLDKFDRTVELCTSAAVDIGSVHTPHVSLDESEYIQAANDLADALDAFLVVHSGKILLSDSRHLYDSVDFTVEHGFENNTGDSVHHIEHTLFNDDRDLVLDTAHLYTSTSSVVDSIEWLLRERGDHIPHIHFCDSTKQQDGLPFGDGEMDMGAIGRVIKQHYDGRVVLEVMPPAQKAALAAFNDY